MPYSSASPTRQERRDSRDDAHGLADDQEALVLLMTRNHITVESVALFGKPLDVSGGIANLSLCFG